MVAQRNVGWTELANSDNGNDDDDDDNNNNKQHMWNVKTKVIPVIIEATGTISKSFRKYVSNIPGKHEVGELQKTAILGTAHILRKALM
jgi:hypothetical protein